MNTPPKVTITEAAGDYVAGDLTPEETAAFRAALRDNTTLSTETDFWNGLRGGWSDGLENDTLGAHFADDILHRRNQEQHTQPRIIQLPRWAIALTSSAAAALLVWTLMPAAHPQGKMYAEDGAQLVTTGPTGPWESYAPRALVSTVSNQLTLSEVPGKIKPWAGMWTRPINVTSDNHEGGGHLVLRIAGGSPADKAGLRPGDIIRTVADCPVFSPSCIAHQLALVVPGQTIAIEWWRPSTGEQVRTTLTFETLYE